MKQVVQNMKSGELYVDDVPRPSCRPGFVSVKTLASAVSAGTERSKVEVARKSLIGKALARPDQVKKVVDTIKREGLSAAINKVQNRLDSLSPLGYSAAGRVIEVGEGVSAFRVGDLVACAGAGYANHAEFIAVPENLCAAIPEGVALDQAAFATIGAIALQGVRQAEPRFGEVVCVLGLGLLGLITVQLLRASGCRVVGVDLDASKLDLAKRFGAEFVTTPTDQAPAAITAFTGGIGVDATIIAAATSSNAPFVLAGEIARDHSRVVLVGAVPLDIPRSPYYEKELDVRLSRSYGPGRYDPAYEEGGSDYPVGYVRWTEQRNLGAFLQAIRSGDVNLDAIITHRVSVENADKAYRVIMGETGEPFLGVVLTYPDTGAASEPERRIATPNINRSAGRVRLGCIGAGGFAGSTLIPAVKSIAGVDLVAIASASGLTARSVAKKHGFRYAAESAEQIIDDRDVNAVIIATRHDSHASLAARALRAGKTVFVEKPLALTHSQLDDVLDAAESNGALIVGFNRRFAPSTRMAATVLRNRRGAAVVHIRVNAGAIPATNWVHDPVVGGGRLIGEGCHFIDLACALVGHPVRRIAVSGISGTDAEAALRDNFALTMHFGDGSIANVIYTSKGNAQAGKERIEVFADGKSVIIDDFKSVTVFDRGSPQTKSSRQDKGHQDEMQAFVKLAAAGGPPPISIDELEQTHRIAFAAAACLQNGTLSAEV